MSAKKSGKQNTTRHGLTFAYATAILLTIAIVGAYVTYSYFNKEYRGDTKWIYIPAGADSDALTDTLATLDPSFGPCVAQLWNTIGGKPTTAHGAYKVTHGTSALSLARQLKRGSQTPVNVTFNNIRTMQQLAERIAGRMEFSQKDFLDGCDSILPGMGFKKTEYPAAFFPDSYEFYWTDSPQKVVKKLAETRNRFWTDERRQQAKQMGLTPVEVAIIASIVEEETAKADERPKVARLYLNRIDRNMPLQADPTVKFAVGDFTLRRINKSHLAVKSPYNTYLNPGLPPGPIRIVTRQTLSDVLNAPTHNYLYMCAKEDFSGYHNFAADFATHQANARRYQAQLNKRGIK